MPSSLESTTSHLLCLLLLIIQGPAQMQAQHPLFLSQMCLSHYLAKEDLRGQPFDVKFFLTSQLNQDCVENLFSVIRMKGQHSDNPDPKQFRHYVQQTMVDAVLTKSKSSNCINDGDQFILSLESMASCDKAGKKARSLLSLDDVPLPLLSSVPGRG
ncbi:hypothetical protein ACOMHN_053746 [Nucella lapillus]